MSKDDNPYSRKEGRKIDIAVLKIIIGGVALVVVLIYVGYKIVQNL